MKTEINYPNTALIVDDEKDIRYLLNIILKQKEIRTKQAGSLAEAEQVLSTDPPSLIFLDNHLPDGFGLDHVHKIRKKLPQSRIIMITAHDNASERQKAHQNGVDYFIPKPFTREIILNTLEKIIGINRA